MNIYNCLSAEYRKWKYILYPRLKPWAMFLMELKSLRSYLWKFTSPIRYHSDSRRNENKRFVEISAIRTKIRSNMSKKNS